MNFYTQLWKQFMRITILSFSILLTAGLISVQAAHVKAQSLDKRVDISFDQEDLYSAVKQLEQTTSMPFAYDASYLDLAHEHIRPASFKEERLEVVLDYLFKGTRIGFKEEAGNILLFKQLYGKIT